MYKFFVYFIFVFIEGHSIVDGDFVNGISIWITKMNIFEEVELFIFDCIMKVHGHTFDFLCSFGGKRRRGV